MRYYISLLLFSLFALTFTSCNTDDLEKDIDALKDRVTNMEAQVQQLNDEMNIIRVLLDGNKTITDYTIDGDTYTLTLSNGEKLTLTPGVVGENYPSIAIGENGNWVIGGKDTGLRAESEDGKDATITPKFKIEPNAADGGKKYWYVSYDEGATWTVLANGLAEGNNTNTNPISNAEVVGDNFKVHFNGQDYFIPIVKGLDCAINLPGGMMGGVWTVARGGESSFTVKVNLAEGDLVRVKAPVDWNAKISNKVAKEVTVTVTPPITASECVIVVEVTHGVNTATDQVKAKTVTNSYWAEYQAGFDVMIGDVVINKYDYPNAVLLSDANVISFTKFDTDKVYFLDTDVTPTAKTAIQDYLILINNNPSKKATVAIGADKHFAFNSSSLTALGLLCKNVVIDGASNINYLSTFEKTSTCAYEYFMMEGCTIKFGKESTGLMLFNIYSDGNIASTFKNFVLNSCRISFPKEGKDAKVFNLNSKNLTFSQSIIRVENNVFYSDDAATTVDLKLLVYADSNVSFFIERNTFINVVPNASQAYIQAIPKEDCLLAKNIVWNGGTWTSTCNWISSKAGSTPPSNKANFEDNLVFDGSGVKWVFFRNSNSLPVGMTNNMTLTQGSPFSSMDFATGTFLLNDTYKGKYGSDIE